MRRRAVGLVNQRIMTIDRAHVAVVVAQPRDVRIVRPQIRARCSYIRAKAVRMTLVQIADHGGQHQDIAGRLGIFEDQLLHTLACICKGSEKLRWIEDELAISTRLRSNPACESENKTS